MSIAGDPRDDVVDVARAMYARGLVVASAGNVSVRSGAGMLITPTRRHPDDLARSDVIALDLDGTAQRGVWAPSLEWRLHAAIYRARPDVQAVVHTHSPYAVARSFDPTPLRVVTEEREYFSVDRIEVAKPARAGSMALAQSAVSALGARPAVLLAHHGAIGVGGCARDALDMCLLVEQQALIAAQLNNASARPGGRPANDGT